MGDKAKKLIGDAKGAVTQINNLLQGTVGNFQGYVLQKNGKVEAAQQLAAHCIKNHPNVMDIEPLLGTDATLKKIHSTWARCKEQAKGFKTSARVGIANLDENMVRIKQTMTALDNMIAAKAQKREQASGLKKIAAHAKTRSLGDLRTAKADLDKAIETMNREMLGIRAYFDKTSKE